MEVHTSQPCGLKTLQDLEESNLRNVSIDSDPLTTWQNQINIHNISQADRIQVLRHIKALTNLLCNHNACQKALISYIDPQGSNYITQLTAPPSSPRPQPIASLLSAIGYYISKSHSLVSTLSCGQPNDSITNHVDVLLEEINESEHLMYELRFHALVFYGDLLKSFVSPLPIGRKLLLSSKFPQVSVIVLTAQCICDILRDRNNGLTLATIHTTLQRILTLDMGQKQRWGFARDTGVGSPATIFIGVVDDGPFQREGYLVSGSAIKMRNLAKESAFTSARNTRLLKSGIGQRIKISCLLNAFRIREKEDEQRLNSPSRITAQQIARIQQDILTARNAIERLRARAITNHGMSVYEKQPRSNIEGRSGIAFAFPGFIPRAPCAKCRTVHQCADYRSAAQSQTAYLPMSCAEDEFAVEWERIYERGLRKRAAKKQKRKARLHKINMMRQK